jgi:glycosyltransferase involved in cell wall biosynthesis
MKVDGKIRYSIVVPLFNEEGSAATLYVALTQVMRSLADSYEILFVDDGSTDRTQTILNEIYEADSCVRVITLGRNFGQTAALKAGFDAAQGETIIAMDGDLQHDPAEIPSFIAKLDEGFDLVSGWRSERKDTWLTRRLPSRIANWAMAKLSGVPLHDFGTTFKAYRRNVIHNLPLYGELHRFIPALAAWSGARITEIPITNPPRQHGTSKFWLGYSTKPLHFFGFFGISAAGIGVLTGMLVLVQKLVIHAELIASNISLAFGSIALVLAGVQILCLGLVSEMMSRTYYESQRKPIYAARITRKSDLPLRVRLASPRHAGESVRDGFGESRRTQYARQSSGEHVIS